MAATAHPPPSGPDPQQQAQQAVADRARASWETTRLAVRTRERHAAVHALLAEGHSIRAICTRPGLARGTVRRLARAASVEALVAEVRAGRPSMLDPFKPYLHQRFGAGVTNARSLYRDLCARGYRGSYHNLRDYLRPCAPPCPKSCHFGRRSYGRCRPSARLSAGSPATRPP